MSDVVGMRRPLPRPMKFNLFQFKNISLKKRSQTGRNEEKRDGKVK